MSAYIIKFQKTNFYRHLSNSSKLIQMLHGMKLFDYSTYKDTRITVNDYGDVYTIHIISSYELAIEPSIKCKLKTIQRFYDELDCFFDDKLSMERIKF
ncbi:MAG: hypothetical protein GPJ52_01970 [Candidatus Heimdallarchaeota archaeon]|nr:hypothetical protein [Candidatus Heimdallarchaeota archaeon]